MPERRPQVLVVEDDPAIRRFLRTSLAAHGYDVALAETAAQALAAAAKAMPDLVLLDLGLPDADGLEVIRALRRDGPVPILVLSVRDDEAGKVEALDLGADDYVVKPVGIDELLARLRAALRHRLQQQGEPPLFRAGDVEIDRVRRLVRKAGAEVHLSPREWEVLQALVRHAGKVVTHRQLLREIWGHEDGADVQYLRVYVGQLRHKLEDDPARPRLLLTETAVGYRLAG